MESPISVVHKGIEFFLAKNKYNNNNRIVLSLVDKSWEQYSIVTVNIPEFNLTGNQILIKNWSENEGILKTLVDHKIVHDTLETIRTGFVKANICELLIDVDTIPPFYI